MHPENRPETNPISSPAAQTAELNLAPFMTTTAQADHFTVRELSILLPPQMVRTDALPPDHPVQLPEELQMKLLTAATEQTGDSRGQIRFFPDGSSSGGRVTLTRDQKEWRVEIAWLTGEVRIEEDR